MKRLLFCSLVSFSTMVAATPSDVEVFKAWSGHQANPFRYFGQADNGGPCSVMISNDLFGAISISLYPINSEGNADLIHSTFAHIFKSTPHQQILSTSDNELTSALKMKAGFDRDNIFNFPIPYLPKSITIRLAKTEEKISSASVSWAPKGHLKGCYDLVEGASI